jgi:mannosylglycerate hydrolase MGH1-like protein/alpha-galactosidase-like protein/F5/8 type C domain-containing protein/glycosyl hydrolase family 65
MALSAVVPVVLGAALAALPGQAVAGQLAAGERAAAGHASAGSAAGADGVITPPASPYPSVGPGTHFLDDAALLTGMSQPGWYEANIPFLSVPDPTIQSVYYYRWRVFKEHLRETQPGTGQIITEFLPNAGYSAPFNGIAAATGHQIMEGRWARDQSYDDSDLSYWLTGPGLASQSVDPYAPDWADEYSNWLVYAAWEQTLVTGDMSSLEAMEPALIKQFDSWSAHINKATGLYWQLPVWDAMEQSASSYASSNSYSGVPTLRPTVNAYQYGAAEVISRIAAMKHQTATAREFAAKAAALKADVQRYLWSDSQQFFDDVLLPGNPSLSQLDERQETGYVPWYFDMPSPSDSVAWSQLMDPQGFFTPYGPTTLEVRSPLYMYDAYTPGAGDGGCCHWDGPSWPYATSQTLTGLANLLDDYPAQNSITAADYDTLLENYAATQMKNGSPYVAEAHDPSNPVWIYDASDHSEDYMHSTFNDLVISGLMGLRPQPGNTLAIKPLVPSSWSYFVLENVPYHGHNVTLMYDRTGDRYHQGPGFHVYLDGRLVAHTPNVQDLTIRIPAKAPDQQPGSVFVDDTVNTTGSGYPMPSASYTWPDDSVWNAVDGNVWYDEIPEVDTRWTNYESPNSSDYLAVDLGASIPIDEVRYYSYCDGGGIQDPAGYLVQYWTGSAWEDIPDQTRTPAAPACNDLNQVTFPPVTTSQVRLVLTNPAGHYVGVTELEAGSWASTAARLSLRPPTDQPLQVTAGQPATVTAAFTNASGQPETVRSVSLDMPPGWTAAPSGPAAGTIVRPGATADLTWTVTPSAGAQPGDSFALWAYANFSQGRQELQTQAEARAQVAFSLAPFTNVQVNDQFTTNDLAGYTQLHPTVTQGYQVPGETAPIWSVGGGQASASTSASSSEPWFGMLQSGTAPASDESVTVVGPAKFLGDAKTQDSVFLGLAKDAKDYVMTWYNNVSHTVGFDLNMGGVLEPTGFQSSCCADVTINAGDRFALEVSGNTITSWVEPGGTGPWQELLSTTVSPLLDLTNPEVLAQYHFTFGLRGDFGTMAAASFEGASEPPVNGSGTTTAARHGKTA